MEENREPRKPESLRALVVALGFVLLSFGFAGATVCGFGTRTYQWRAFGLQVGVAPSWQGQTRLIFAPLGEVRARTHATPIALKVTLQSIGFDEMRRLVTQPPPRRELERDFERVAQRSLRDLAARQIGLGTLGALLVPLLLRLRRPRYWLLAGTSGGGFVALVLVATLHSFQPQAFQSPTYTGSLQQAPWMIALVSDAVSNSEALGNKLRHVASNLQVLYGRINAVPDLAGDEDMIKILHVSDIHNNPAAVRFVRDLAQKIGIEAVIDTGDLTDFGTPLETQLSRGLGQLGVPYLFVAGNHDSQATVRAIAANANARILDGANLVTIAGLRILGAPDPSASRPTAGNVNTADDALRAASDALRARYQALNPPPDLVCVHNPRQAEPLLGTARVLLCGHLHRASVEVTQNTIVCNAGTTGAAGARYFDKPEGVPFSAAILHFERSSAPGVTIAPRLRFIDQVVLDGSLSRYSISRRTFADTNVGSGGAPRAASRAARF